MKIRIFVSVLIVAVVGTIFLLKSNDNGGSVMADTQKINSNKKVLIAYFSTRYFDDITAKFADTLAKATGADLFEIKPAKPYTIADLDLTNKKSRSSVEMADINSRPKIANKVVDMNKYDVIFVGFPIWRDREPSIIDTFMESYDFSGKQVVPFSISAGSGMIHVMSSSCCYVVFITSGSSGMGKSGSIMQKLAPKAKVDSGNRFLSSSVSENDLKSWASKWL